METKTISQFTVIADHNDWSNATDATAACDIAESLVRELPEDTLASYASACTKMFESLTEDEQASDDTVQALIDKATSKVFSTWYRAPQTGHVVCVRVTRN